MKRHLNHLKCGQILFPPQILLHVRSESCKKVVGVHDDVDQRVDGPAKGVVAAREPPHQGPAIEGHDTVVDDLKQSHSISESVESRHTLYLER